MTFASTLQQLRKEKKITQEQLASHLGVSGQAVSKWENGSYPEGDLIPRIADFFEVSTDYLYGREQRNVTIEQQLLDALRKTEGDDYFALMDSLIWACQIGAWASNKAYYNKPYIEEGDPKTAAALINNKGFSYQSLNKNHNFHISFTEPESETGLMAWLENKPKVRKLFGYLSDEENVRILTYLYSLGYGEYAHRETISDVLGIRPEKVEKALDFLCGELAVSNNGHGPCTRIQLVGKDGKVEMAYGVDMAIGGLLFGLFAVADSYADTPCGYHMQLSNRSKSWINRKAMEENGRV